MLLVICKVAVTPISTQVDDLWNKRYGVDINTQARKILCDSAETTIEARVCVVPSLHMLVQPMPKSRYSGEDMKKCIEVTGIANFEEMFSCNRCQEIRERHIPASQPHWAREQQDLHAAVDHIGSLPHCHHQGRSAAFRLGLPGLKVLGIQDLVD